MGITESEGAIDEQESERRSLGLRLRELRRIRGLTTRDLASRAHVSASLVSQLENGRTGASLASLRQIAAGLDVPIAELFLQRTPTNGDFGESMSPPLAHVVRSDRRRRLQIPESNFIIELLTPDLRGNIEFVWFELDPGHPPEQSMPHRSPGEECALVLAGEMHLVIGDQEYVLGPGDSVRFDPSIPHRIENRGTEKLIEISAITPPSF